MKELFNKIIKTIGTNFIALLIGLVTLIITSRLLGPEGRGIYASILTWVTFFSTVANLSLGQYASYQSANIEGNAWLKQTFSNLIFMLVLSTLLVWGVAIGLNFFNPQFFEVKSKTLLFIGLFFIPFMIWGQYNSHLLLAINRIDIVNKGRIYSSVLGLICLLILLVVLDLGITGALSALLFSNIILSLYGINTIYNETGRAIKPDLKGLWLMLKNGLQIHICTIGILLYNTIGILMVDKFLDNVHTGYFQMSVRLFEIMLVIPNAIATVMFSNMGNQGVEESWKNIRKMLRFIVLMGGVVMILGYFGSAILIPLVLGNEFTPSISVFQILLLNFIPLSIKIAIDPYWIGYGKFFGLSLVSITYGLISVVVSYVLIPKYGMHGAAWATVIASLFYLIVTIVFIFKTQKKQIT